MINYPPDFPVSARALVERAISDEEDDFIDASAGADPDQSLLGDSTYPGMWDTSDRAAVSYVVAVFATVAQASCDAAREGNWPAEKLRTTTVDFLDQLTQLAYAHKHSKRDRWFGPMTLDDFTTIVHREVRTFEFWSGLQDTIRELAGTHARANESASEAEPSHASATAVTEPQRPALAASANVFRRMPNGGGWEIQYGGQRRAGLHHLFGFELIRTLLENPQISISAVKLIGGDAVSVDGAETRHLSAGSPVIDDQARREYKMALHDIELKVKIADNTGNPSEASRLREEAHTIKQELRRSTGLSGRTRLVGSDLERARKTARGQYTRALRTLQKALLDLYGHLEKSITSGHFYMYDPDPDVLWQTRPPVDATISPRGK